MPRGRLLAQAISFSESIESMSEWAQLLFDRLVIHVDDWGRMEGSPVVIKGRAKPLSPRSIDDFTTAIAEMVACGVVVAYLATDQIVVIQITKHDEHQRVDRRTDSQYVGPEEGTSLTTDEYVKIVSRGKARESAGFSRRREEKRREEKRREIIVAAEPRQDRFDSSGAFDQTWLECLAERIPNPVHKAAAKRSYQRTVKCAADAERCRIGRRNYAASKRVRDGYVQDAGTWFRDWEQWAAMPPQGVVAIDESSRRQGRIDALRAWIDARGRTPETPISPVDFDDYIAWIRQEREGCLEQPDGALNDYESYVRVKHSANQSVGGFPR